MSIHATTTLIPAEILARIWKADDWAAAIRDPQLAHNEPLNREQLAEWQRMLAAT